MVKQSLKKLSDLLLSAMPVLVIGFSPIQIAHAVGMIADNELPGFLEREIGDGSASMIVLDNSKYMLSEVMYNNGTGKEYTHIHNQEYISDFASTSDKELRCVGFNLLAYNPDYSYSPWRGYDAEGNSYQDYKITKNFTAVRYDPYFPDDIYPNREANAGKPAFMRATHSWNGINASTQGPGLNLTSVIGHEYYDWNGNKDAPFWQYASDCSNTAVTISTSLSDEAKGNYANWFAYYRSKRHVMRRLASEVIYQSQGITGLNSVSARYAEQMITPLVDLNPANSSAAQARENLNYLMYNFSGPSADTGAEEGRHISALASTFQYLQHGSVALKITQADVFNGLTSPLTTSWQVQPKPINFFGGDNVCNVARLSMVSPASYMSDGGNSYVAGWTFPCEPILNVYSPPIYNNSCASGWSATGFGYGDTDSKNGGNWDSDWDGSPYAGPPAMVANGRGETTLSDITMHYFEIDVSKTSQSDGNPKIRDSDDKPHFITDMAGFGVTTNKIEAGFNAITGNYWNNPLTGDVEDRLDDAFHAAFNARGKFISPRFPAELVDLFSGPNNPGNFDDYKIQSISGGIAKIETGIKNGEVAGNNGFTFDQLLVFRGTFNTSDWSGNLFAYQFEPDGNGIEKLVEFPDWVVTVPNPSAGPTATQDLWAGAGDILNFEFNTFNTLNPAAAVNWNTRSSRLFSIGVSGGNRTGIALAWDALSATQTGWIDSTAPDLNNDGSQNDGERVLNYFVGDDSDEGTGLNQLHLRTSLMGDIMNSTPTFVNGNTPIVYVGSNGGFLHAIDAYNGSELFAYMPESIFPKLGLRADGADKNHRYLVDGPITVGAMGNGELVLVSGLGAGGQGYFSLNVTDPVNANGTPKAASQIVNWEINSTQTNFTDLGYTFAKPVFAKLSDDTDVVLLANGFESTNGKAVLYVVNADTGVRMSQTFVGSTTDNGLSAPGIIVDENGHLVAAYAGDLKGVVHRFNFAMSGGLLAVGTQPIFQAKAGQTITTQVAVVANHPDTGNQGAMIAFGTGKYLVNGDHTTTAQQTMYVVGDPKFIDSFNSGTSIDVSKLVQRTHPDIANGQMDDGTTNTATIDWQTGATQKYGWYWDLPATGERLVSAPRITAPSKNFKEGRVQFTTMSPIDASCAKSVQSWNTQMSLQTGLALYNGFDNERNQNVADSRADDAKERLSSTSTGGMADLTVIDWGDDKTYTTNNNGQSDGASREEWLSNSLQGVPNQPGGGTVGGSGMGQQTSRTDDTGKTSFGLRRTSWREIRAD